jgi:hypothetical protein
MCKPNLAYFTSNFYNWLKMIAKKFLTNYMYWLKKTQNVIYKYLYITFDSVGT